MMASNEKYKGIMIFDSWVNKLANLDDTEFKNVILTYCKYVRDGINIPDNLKPIENIMLMVMKDDYDRNSEYKKKELERVQEYKRKKEEKNYDAVITRNYEKLQENTSNYDNTNNLYTNNLCTNTNDNSIVCCDATQLESQKPKRQPENIPPSIEEVYEYCKQRNNGIDAEYFLSYYDARGWRMNGGQKIKSWKSCIITWEKNGLNQKSSSKKEVETKNPFLRMAIEKGIKVD